MTRSARGLLDALDAAGVTIAATSRTQLVARPTPAVDASLLALVKAMKPELLGAFSRADSASARCTIVACARCDSEFTTVPASLCPWCAMTEFSSIAPGSRTEISHLETQSAPGITVPNCPHVEKNESGDSGDSWGQNFYKTHTYARAKRITQNSVPTVPNGETVPTLFERAELVEVAS